MEATGIGPGARVLEVACGTGRNFQYIQDRIGPGGQIVGLDYSEEMLEGARHLSRRNGWSNVELVRGDAALCDMGDEPFDAVVSVLGVSAVPEHVAALGRCRDVLRPGGVLSVCDARLFSGALRFLNPAVRFVYGRWAAWTPDRDIPVDMRQLFGNVTVESSNLGTFFIATSGKDGAFPSRFGRSPCSSG